ARCRGPPRERAPVTAAPHEVRIYGRPECHLCDQARGTVLELAAEAGVQVHLTEIDIESDPVLLREYLERIPVIWIGGREVSELVPNCDTLRSTLATLGT
ncbi:MAG TPA: glutaredoxin family protein, partial [Solirubrobacterales bacterium]|nr:glutaredoxin family protein [Solirubrobacterales bacterium]